MVREFKLPDVGEGVAEGEIVGWLVEEGDEVSEDQPVAEVETDKAVVEVPSPVNGSVREIKAEEGEVVPVGTVIITFDVEGEEPAEAEEPTESEEQLAEEAADVGGGESDAAGAAEAEDAEGRAEAEATSPEAEEAPTSSGRVFAAPSARRLARELGVDIAAVDGSGPGGRVTERDVRAAAEDGDAEAVEAESEPESGAAEAEEVVAEAEEPVGGPADAQPATASGAGPTTEAADRERTLAAPATRRVAEEEGVDINEVPAVEERDGEAFVTAEAVREYAQAQRAAQEADVAAIEGAERAEREREERVPYRGIRRTIGQQMERSKFTAPHVTHHDTARVSELVEARRELKARAEERGVRLTYMPFVLKALVAALKEYPYLNSQLDEENEEIILKNHYDVGIAVATDAGLMVPVVRDVDRKGILQLASETNELAQKARERSISREEMQGSTFTVTNFGAIGGEYATPIINHPEVAILGLGELAQRPVVEDGEVVADHTLPISLSIDHRVIDGADAARFANELIEYLTNPTLLLLE